MLFVSKLTYSDSASRKRKSLVKKMRDSILSRIPEVKPMPLWLSVSVFTILSFIGVSIGATIGTYVFFGIATLLGLIVISENNKYVRWFINKSNKMLDILIFGLTIYATAMLGVTISAALVFAGLGFTLVYAPWLRQRAELIELSDN